MIIVPVALILIIAFLIWYNLISKKYNYWKERNIPYLQPKFPFGNFKSVLLFRDSLGEFFQNIYNASKECVVGIWVFGQPLIVIRSPDIIKEMLIKDFGTFKDRTVFSNKDADPVCAHMMFLTKNPQWKIIRQKMSPLFTTTKLKDMIKLMNKSGDDMNEYLDKHNGGIFDAKELCMKYTVDVITSIGFGLDAMCFKKESAEFRTVAGGLFEASAENYIRFVSYFLVPGIAKFFGIAFFNPTRIDFLRKAVWDVIDHRTRTQTKRNDLIDAYITLMGTNFSDGFKFEGDKLVSQAVQFFAAGFETTSSTIAFTLYELSFHQTIQDKLRKEIQQIDETEVTYESIQNMHYLDQVVSETLRKYPALPFLDRRCEMDYKIPNTEMVIEKWTPVYFSILGLHYDPLYFPNPQAFDPERFTPENLQFIQPNTYIPFGLGPRNCIGKRLGVIGTKLSLIKILSKYRVETCPETVKTIKFDPLAFTIALKHGLKVKFTKL